MSDQIKVSFIIVGMFIAILFISVFRGATEIDSLIATQDSLRIEVRNLRSAVLVAETKVLILEAYFK